MCQALYTAMHMPLLPNLNSVLCSRKYYNPHITEKETEVEMH